MGGGHFTALTALSCSTVTLPTHLRVTSQREKKPVKDSLMNITTEAVHQLQSPPPPPSCSRSPLPSSCSAIVILRPDSSSQQRWFLERRDASEPIGNRQAAAALTSDTTREETRSRLRIRQKKGAFTGATTAELDPEELIRIIITTVAIKPRPSFRDGYHLTGHPSR